MHKKIIIIESAIILVFIIFSGYLLFSLGVYKTQSQIDTLISQSNQNTQTIQQIVGWINQVSQPKK